MVFLLITAWLDLGIAGACRDVPFAVLAGYVTVVLK